MFFFLTAYFPLRFLCESDLRCSICLIMGSNRETQRNNFFQVRKMTVSSTFFIRVQYSTVQL